MAAVVEDDYFSGVGVLGHFGFGSNLLGFGWGMGWVDFSFIWALDC